MVHVRQSLYSLLKPKKKKGNVVNLLGFFSPLMDDCELYGMLEKAGVKAIFTPGTPTKEVIDFIQANVK